jgi:3-oxoacyl-[acyl-carrier protein] reductase
MRFKNKVAIVTGAGRGIGRSIAKSLAFDGAYVGCNSLSNSCEKTVEEIIQSGSEAMPLQFDVASTSQVSNKIKYFIDKMGKIDILINNAGGSAGREFVHKMEEKIWDRTININLKGCFNCSKAVLDSMISKKYGKIINIASIRAETGLEQDAAYAAAKSGIYGFTRSLAKEVAKYNINVNVISPGIIKVGEQAVLPWEDYLKIVPLGIGKPEDIAQTVLFLASDDARYITGQVIHVNGGWFPLSR